PAAAVEERLPGRGDEGKWDEQRQEQEGSKEAPARQVGPEQDKAKHRPRGEREQADPGGQGDGGGEQGEEAFAFEPATPGGRGGQGVDNRQGQGQPDQEQGRQGDPAAKDGHGRIPGAGGMGTGIGPGMGGIGCRPALGAIRTVSRTTIEVASIWSRTNWST